MASVFKAGTPNIIGVGVTLRSAELHSAEAIVSRQTIEDGSPVSDHIILQPRSVEIIAEVSNIDRSSQTLGETAKSAWLEFLQQLQSRQLFDVMTTHELYTDMAFTGIVGDHTAPYRGRLSLRLRFEKMDIVQTSIVRVPSTRLQSTGDNPVDKTASSEVNGGQVPAKSEADAPSLAAQALDALGG